MTLDIDDRFALLQLAARYGNVMDDRDWDRLTTLFTDDAPFIVKGLPSGDLRFDGVDGIRRAMAAPSAQHPVAHHITNVEIREDLDPLILTYKVVAPELSGGVHSTDYADRVVKTPAGWRIAEHVATRRHA